MTMDELIADSVSEPRFEVIVTGVFALFVIAMAGAGLYSVVSCLFSQRTNEIAIRMSLGATHLIIIRTVLANTSVWIAVGLSGGLGLGLAASKVLRSLAYVEAPGSPWTYLSVVLFFTLLMLVAVFKPVQRASHLEPAVALRME